MKSMGKLFTISALTVFFAFGLGRTAPAASSLKLSTGATAACSCCPSTCGGGTYFGCWSSVDHPDNAVTCIYTNSEGKHFNCVSCMRTTTEEPATADTKVN
jgi:hypothetical protein